MGCRRVCVVLICGAGSFLWCCIGWAGNVVCINGGYDWGTDVASAGAGAANVPVLGVSYDCYASLGGSNCFRFAWSGSGASYVIRIPQTQNFDINSSTSFAQTLGSGRRVSAGTDCVPTYTTTHVLMTEGDYAMLINSAGVVTELQNGWNYLLTAAFALAFIIGFYMGFRFVKPSGTVS